MVGMTGFEPAALRSQTERSDQTELHPYIRKIGTPGGTRTPNRIVRSHVLYPLSYRGGVRRGGFEPPTFPFGRECSIH